MHLSGSHFVSALVVHFVFDLFYSVIERQHLSKVKVLGIRAHLLGNSVVIGHDLDLAMKASELVISKECAHIVF